ncbi:T9SS type A sorting domain-containing protein [Chryseobacterium tructae]|uniref:T9SS type A sorting domain-containing protein n=1 Tax=Chryseobacterium tructae TaxID=1037380 RepID=A0ABV7Y1C2_9FLAO
MKRILLTCLTAFYYCVSAQVGPPQMATPNTNNGYGVTQSSETYAPLSASRTVWQSGATLATDLVSGAIPLPSVFRYNNQNYNSVYISNNGFVTLGSATTNTTYSSLSTDNSPTTHEAAFAGFSVNLRNANTSTSEIAYETVGNKFIVQFTDLQGNSGSAAQLLNFQIQLNLTTGAVAIVYGNCVSGSSTLSGQVGIRGSEGSDINNFTGTNWATPAVGTSITSSLTLGTSNGTTVPASGLTLTFTPGTWQSAPNTFATLPFTETFSTWENGNSTLDLPNANYWRTWPSRGDNSWRQSDISSSGFTSTSGWTSTSGSVAIGGSAVAPTARFHSYNGQYASGYMDLYINLSSGSGDRILSFDYANPSGTDVLKIQISTDNGTTFTDIGAPFGVTSSTAPWVTNYVNLASSSPNAIIRFLAKGDNGSDDIYVDNIKVSAVAVVPDCSPITAPANASTGVAVTPSFKWDASPNAASYKLKVGTTPGGSNVIAGVDVGNVLTYTIPAASQLLYGTTYYATILPANSTGTASGCTEVSFTTKNIGCPSVTLPASGASGVSLTPTITWTAVTDATGYKVSIGTTAGGTDVMNNVDVGNITSYTLSAALNYTTKYYYTVNAYTPTSTSASCTERNFTTVCGAENIPTISQGFSTLTPTCWSTAKGDVTANSTLTYGSSKWTAAPGFANTGTNTAVKLNLYGTSTGDWLISQPINLGATPGANRIRYRMAVTSYSGTTAQSTLGTHQVRVIISTDGGTTWSNTNAIKTYTGAGTYSNIGQTETIDLSAYSGTIKVAFVATTSSTSPDIYFHLDDFIVEPTPTCMEPDSPVVANVTGTTSDLSWNAPASLPANGYEYYYSTNNTVPTANVAISGTSTTTSTVLNGLSPGTAYYVWVRSACSATNKSIWSQAATFATACAPLQVYSQNFDTIPVDALPTCWTSIGNAVSNVKVYAYSTTVASAPNALYIYSSSNTSIAMVSTPELVGLDSNNATLSFKGRANLTAGGVVQIGYLTNPTDTSTFVVLDTYTASSTSVIDNYSLNITGVPAGVNKLVLRHTGVPSNSVLIDDFVYQAGNLSTSEVATVKNEIKVYPNPFSDTLNITDVSKVKVVQIIDVSGRVLKTIETPSSVLQLSDLKQGMYLVVLHMKDGSKQTIKVIKR